MAMLSIIVSLCLYFHVGSALSYPNNDDFGFVYGNSSNDAQVKMEVFIDLMCSESKMVYPVLLKLANFYGPEKLNLKFHLFPLPFFRNAYKSAKGAYAVGKLSHGKRTTDWLKTVFEQMNHFSNSNTRYLTEPEIEKKFVEVAESLGFDKNEFTNAFLYDREVSHHTLWSYRYGCSRGVYSVPTFFVNGFQIEASYNWNFDKFVGLIGSR